MATINFGPVSLGTVTTSDDRDFDAIGAVDVGEWCLLELGEDASGKLAHLPLIAAGLIRKVGADSVDLTPDDFRSLASIPGVRSYDFDSTSITDADLASFAGLPIRALTVGGTPVSDSALPTIASLRELRDLFLSRTAVSDVGIAALAHHPELAMLAVAGTSVTTRSSRVIASLAKLEELHFDAADDDLAAAAAKPCLNWLHSPRAVMTAAGYRALAGCPGLTTLGVSQATLGQNECVALGAIESLEGVWLSAATFTDADIAVALGSLGRLEGLEIARTAAGDAAAAALADAGSVERVNFANSAITDKGLRLLARCNNLQVLGLNGTAVTDEGIASLAVLPNLVEVAVDDTAVTPRGLAVLPQVAKPFELG